MGSVFNMMNRILVVLGVIGVFLIVVMISGSKSSQDLGFSNKNDLRVTSVHLPDQLNFAGEKVPLENFDVRESLDKEMLINSFYHSQTLLYIKRANRYFPVIEPILRKNGIPEDFKYMALAESGLTNVSSPAGACGFWQFIKETAEKSGLEVNSEVDERYNLEKATEAACKYILRSYNVYKNWTMAAASYNVGLNGLNKQITRQYSTNYYDIALNDETARYIFRITALKAIIEHPEDFGFAIGKDDLYPPFQYTEITVDSPIKDLARFAFQNGTNYKMVKILNPWLRTNFLTNKNRKVYKIKIPAKGMRNIVSHTDKTDIDSIIARTVR